MKKIIIICILSIFGVKGFSQLFEDRNNFYIGYQSSIYLGNGLFNDHGTISPSFYSNLTSNNGLVIKDIFKLSPIFCAGFKLGFLMSANWQSNNYVSYNGSKSTTINLQPVIQIHSKFRESGLYNRMKLYGELSPVIGFSMVSIKNNLFDISSSEENNDTFISNDLIYGLEAGVGCEYAFTNKTGAFINLSVQEGFINTPLFLDNRYTLLGLNVGVRINLSKVKRFNY
jgi:hypothetical protein